MLPRDVRQLLKERLSREQGTLLREAPHRLALCSPSRYGVAMASLGFQTVYREINARPGWAAERAFLPDGEDPWGSATKSGGDAAKGLVTYESGTPVGNFPVLAFSVAYELELVGLARFLQVAGVPMLRTERAPGDALVVVGGPLTTVNPRPLGAFADVVVLGEVEDCLDDLLQGLEHAPRKEAVLQALAGREGVWVPECTPEPGVRAVASRTRLPAYAQIVTPESEFPGMFLVEVARGCSRRCAYCVMQRHGDAGMRPIPKERVLAAIPKDARRVGLIAAAVTDHPEIVEIIRTLVERDVEVGVSSLRPEKLSDELVALLGRGGMRTLTVAADGASQRLRDALRRGTTEEHLFAAARLAKVHGMRRLKVYELLGVPSEQDEDVEEMARFLCELARIVPVAVTVSPFVPKPGTPLEHEAFAPLELVRSRLNRLRGLLRGRVEMRAASLRDAWVEWCLAQGDALTGEAVARAVQAGGGYQRLRQALLRAGVSESERKGGAGGEGCGRF